MSTSSHSLCTDNHSIVYSACERIRSKWEDLAARLSVERPSVEAIRADGKDCADCLRKLLDEWLKRSSPEQPLPSWRGLCDALSHLDLSLSERISAEHHCGCSLCTGRDAEAPIGLVSPLYNEIYQKLKNPVGVAEYLFSERIFSLHQLEKIQESSGNEKEVLFTSLESAVSVNQNNLRVFGKALMKEEATHSLGKSILANCIKEEFPSHSRIKKIIVEMKYKKEFQSMRVALGQLCASTVTLLSQKKVDVAKLKNQLELAFPELGSDLEKCNSSNDVVKNVIRPRVSLVQIDYLEAVFDLFKLAKRAIQEYNRKVDELYETIKVAYGQLLMEEFDTNTSNLESIKFVLDWDENEHLLKDIRDLFNMIVRNYSKRVKVIVVSKGNSIVVECCVPAHLLPVITRMIQDSEVILNREKVISVIAGGRTIFKRIVTVEQKAEFQVIPKKENNDSVVDKSSDESVIPSPGPEPGKRLNPELLAKEKMFEVLSAEFEMIKEKEKKLEETVMMKDSMIKQMSAELDDLKNRKDTPGLSEGFEDVAKIKNDLKAFKRLSQKLYSILPEGPHPELDEEFLDAAESGNVSVVTELLSMGIDVNCKHKGGDTALMKASAKGHYEVVELLLSAQARVNQTGWVRNCDSALMKASAEGHYEVVKLLLSSQARVDQTGRDYDTALMKASAEGHYEVVKLLLSAQAHVNQRSRRGYTALMRASAGGHSDVVQLLFSAGASLDEKDYMGFTALMEASANGNSDVVKLLLSAGASLNEKSSRGYTALMEASAKGHSDVVKLLLSAGASLDEKNKWGYTALMRASASGHSDVVKLLLSAGAILNEKDYDRGCTALIEASAGGHSDLVQLLLSAGAILDEKNNRQQSAIHFASAKGHVDVAKALLSAGRVDLRATDQYGQSPIMIAKVLGHHDLIELFVSTGLVSSNELDKYSLPEGWRAELNYDGKIYYYKTNDPEKIHHEKHPLFEDV